MTSFRKPYDSHKRFPTIIDGPSMTQQNFKNECDINNILKKYRKTGLLNHVTQNQGHYADLSEPTDYQTALNCVINAENSFSSLPSDLRKRFHNNPGEFLAFATDPKNIDEMYSLGLMSKPKETLEEPIQAKPETVPQEPAGGELNA